MKVAIFINELNIRGGTHKQVLRLCEYLDKQGVEFILLTKYYNQAETYPEFAKYNPISLYSTQTEFKKRRNIFMKIRNNIRFMNYVPKDYDIVNVHDCSIPWILYLAIKRANVKTVWQINDLPGCFKVGVGAGSTVTINDKINKRLYCYLAKRVNAITVNVTKNKERVEKCMGKAATVLYCGVDINNNLCKHEYTPSLKNKIRLLSTGVFFPYRNYETLVLVIKQLCKEGYDARLDIIGSTELDKEYANRIIELINDKNLKEYVKVWGQVDEITYNELYNKANIFAFVNIDQSWGLTVFEAMSAGIPTIVSNSVGAIELLHDGEDSIILNPKDIIAITDRIKKLVSDEEYYNRISDHAYTIVKDYSWDKLYSSRLVKIFERLISHE